jgi:hypothetical protein
VGKSWVCRSTFFLQKKTSTSLITVQSRLDFPHISTRRLFSRQSCGLGKLDDGAIWAEVVQTPLDKCVIFSSPCANPGVVFVTSRSILFFLRARTEYKWFRIEPRLRCLLHMISLIFSYQCFLLRPSSPSLISWTLDFMPRYHKPRFNLSSKLLQATLFFIPKCSNALLSGIDAFQIRV